MSVTLTLTFQCHSMLNMMVPLDSICMASLLLFNSNLWPHWAPLCDIRLQNLRDVEFDFSRSFKVKFNGVFGLPTYDFLFMK